MHLFFLSYFRGSCNSNRGNTFSITLADINKENDNNKLNETTGQWIKHHFSKHDYELFHEGLTESKHWAHYQAEQDSELVTSFRDRKYFVVGHINGACMATLKIQFFDDLKGTRVELVVKILER